MSKPVLTKVDKDKKVKFDQKQLSKVISLLNDIIGKEKDKAVRNSFRNMKAVLTGTYPNLYALKQATVGLKTIIGKAVQLLSEEEQSKDIQKKKKLVKNIYSKMALVLAAAISISSCSFLPMSASDNQVWDVYGASLSTQSDDAIYTIRLDESVVTQLESALNSYYLNSYMYGGGDKTKAMDALNSMSIVLGNTDGALADTTPDGKITLSTDEKLSSYWYSILLHELTHRKQFATKNSEQIGYSNSEGSYNINPMEKNACFSSMMKQAETERDKGHIYAAVVPGEALTVAALLTYRPGYTMGKDGNSLGHYSSDDIQLVHQWVKSGFPTIYKQYEKLSTAKPEVIREYFLGAGTSRAMIKSTKN